LFYEGDAVSVEDATDETGATVAREPEKRWSTTAN